MSNSPESAIAVLTLLLTVAGCSSTDQLPRQLTRVPNAPGQTTPSLQTNTSQNGIAPPISPDGRTEGGVVTAIPEMPGPAVQQSLEVDWISLEGWAVSNRFMVSRPDTPEATVRYVVHTPGGAITLTDATRLAYLDGIRVWLGRAPLSAEGGLFVDSIDIRKNLASLSRPAIHPWVAGPVVVVIDPGHGGENTGAQSVHDGRYEKGLTLDWALRLEPLLARAGWKVFLTRTNDAELSLADRVALADAANADLFISLHFNSSADPSQSGLETYCLTPTGLPSTLTRDYEDDTTRVFPNNAFDEGNLQYAVRVHRAMFEVTGDVDRGIRRARFMTVLRGQNCPAVLIEGGYLSNPREADRIADPAYRQKLAEAVAKALGSQPGFGERVRINPLEDGTSR